MARPETLLGALLLLGLAACEGEAGTAPQARVRFGLRAAATSQSAIARVVVEVSGGTPALQTLSTDLTRGGDPGTWEAVLSAVPAGTQVALPQEHLRLQP